MAAVVAGLVKLEMERNPSIMRDQDGFRRAPATLDACLVHCQLGAGLHVQRLRELEGEVAVGARDAAPGVHVDGRHAGPVSPKPERRSGEPAGRGLARHAALAARSAAWPGAGRRHSADCCCST